LTEVCILFFLTINIPYTLNITALNMLYVTNGSVHSLTASSKDRPGYCQELTWKEPYKCTSAISNKAFRFSA